MPWLTGPPCRAATDRHLVFSAETRTVVSDLLHGAFQLISRCHPDWNWTGKRRLSGSALSVCFLSDWVWFLPLSVTVSYLSLILGAPALVICRQTWRRQSSVFLNGVDSILLWHGCDCLREWEIDWVGRGGAEITWRVNSVKLTKKKKKENWDC